MDDKENNSKMIIESRKMTFTPTNAVMSFNRKKLLEFGICAGEYNVVYEKGKITIVKELQSVII